MNETTETRREITKYIMKWWDGGNRRAGIYATLAGIAAYHGKEFEYYTWLLRWLR